MSKNNQLVSQLFKSPGLLSHRPFPVIASTQYFHIQSPGRKDAESKVEKTSNLLKDKMFASTEAVKKKSPEEEIKVNSQVEVTEESKEVDLPRPSLWDKIVKEVRHYYNGFKLLFLESRIAFRLLRRVLNGHTLTRRERRQVCHLNLRI